MDLTVTGGVDVSVDVDVVSVVLVTVVLGFCSDVSLECDGCHVHGYGCCVFK